MIEEVKKLLELFIDGDFDMFYGDDYGLERFRLVFFDIEMQVV